jgi:hypothetical protein
MSYTSQITWEPLRSINAATFVGTYLPLGGPLIFPSYICKIVNNSTSLVTLSINGATAVDVVPAMGFVLYDEGKGKREDPLSIPAGTQFYVNGVVGTGLVYLVTQYIVQI